MYFQFSDAQNKTLLSGLIELEPQNEEVLKKKYFKMRFKKFLVIILSFQESLELTQEKI